MMQVLESRAFSLIACLTGALIILSPALAGEVVLEPPVPGEEAAAGWPGEEAALESPPVPPTPAEAQIAPLTQVQLLLEELRVGLRVVAPAELAYSFHSEVAPPRVVVDIPQAGPGSVLPVITAKDVAIKGLRSLSVPEQGVRVVLDLNYPVPDWRDSGWELLPGGLYQLTVVAKRHFVQQQEFPVARGAQLVLQRRGELYGPVVVNVLAVLPLEGALQVGIGLARGRSEGLEPVSAIARRSGALAGVNGTFFHTTGLPLGLVVDGGLLVSYPVYDRTAFIILDDGSAGMDRAALRVRLHLPDATLPVQGINRQRKKGEIIVYNQAFGLTTPKTQPVRELIVRDGVVVAVGQGGSPLRPGTVVVAGDPDSRLKSVEAGQPVDVLWELALLGNQVTVPGGRVRLALGAGPRLVEKGEVRVTSAEEQFRPDVAQGRAPRTALGLTAEGSLLLVTVSGRQENLTVGMTLEELAHLMLELGAVEAMNLDGGGSTTMVVRNRVVNMPSEGTERAVSNSVLVWAPAPDLAEDLAATP